ncbi:MAG TPA: hypothetical protein DDZ88_19915 [Verrucomicrobiales bacterium]|nr:hypothetical protein [Verrucomicrobiales bacterium]
MSQQFFHAGNAGASAPNVPPLTAKLPPRAREAVIRREQDRARPLELRKSLRRGVQHRPANAGMPNVEREKEFVHA